MAKSGDTVLQNLLISLNRRIMWYSASRRVLPVSENINMGTRYETNNLSKSSENAFHCGIQSIFRPVKYVFSDLIRPQNHVTFAPLTAGGIRGHASQRNPDCGGAPAGSLCHIILFLFLSFKPVEAFNDMPTDAACLRTFPQSLFAPYCLCVDSFCFNMSSTVTDVATGALPSAMPPNSLLFNP